jgi:NAD(P)-dependent dehydrogenase (short-subunit alcohol dehydrogenase family)
MPKTVVITGSTRGIGRGLASEFLSRGCQVTISGRSPDDVDATVAELSHSAPGRVAGLACEVTDAGNLKALWDTAMAEFGRVDVWINNAGVSVPRTPFQDLSPNQIKTVLDINLNGTAQGCRVALKGMLAQGGGQIWNMEGFGSGGQMQPGMAAYGASKRGVNYLTEALAKELKGSTVKVCTLSPGIVVTDLLTGDYDPDSPEWSKAKKIFNILGDKVETVTPWLAEQVLKTNKNGARVAWLTSGKAFRRFMTASFKKRDLFAGVN